LEPEVTVTVADPALCVVVSCQGSLPSTNPALAVAERSTVPGATLIVSSGPLDEEPPLTVKVHQLSKFLTVSATLPPPLPAEPPLPVEPPLPDDPPLP
jgi:hypothetical protein